MSTPRRQPAEKCSECELREFRLFCNLAPATLARFESIGIQMSYPEGTKIFEEGRRSKGIFVICTGLVKLSATSKDGRTMILKLARAGDVLGLGATLNELPYEVTAQTVEPCELKSVRAAEFLEFVDTYGEVSRRTAQTLAREYNEVFLDVRRLALAGSAGGRLAQLLLEWARTSPSESPTLGLIMALTHDELASMAGISRETVTRLLNQFEREKIIRRNGASILILDEARLDHLGSS